MNAGKISLLRVAALFAAFALVPMHAAAQDYDGDTVLDAADPCPHIFNGTPVLMSSPYIRFSYGGGGPGGGDDSVFIRGLGAFFVTHVPFDPDSVDNVHVTLRRNTNTGLDLWATTLAAGPPWFEIALGGFGGPHRQWDYVGPSPGVAKIKARLRNALVSPSGSGLWRFNVKPAKGTDVAGPLGADVIDFIFELEAAGLCFEAVSATCTTGGSTEFCLP